MTINTSSFFENHRIRQNQAFWSNRDGGADEIYYKKGTAGTCGDVNGDGSVDVRDATKVTNRAADPTYPLGDEWAADVNCDTSIDVRDATKVTNRAADPNYPLTCCT